MILFDNVSKIYSNGKIAVENLNLKINDGEFVFLVGPSGAGKTTMLRLLNCDLRPSKGSLFLDEWEVNKLPPKQIPQLRRKIGFVFQDLKLLKDRTVEENIALTLSISGAEQSSKEGKIRKVLKIIHLEDKGNYFPQQLSLGEQQRVSIGRAIIGGAQVLLADEPTGNLDPKTSWEILKIIKDINKNGTTVIMATHNVDIVSSLKQRVIAIDDGKIVQDKKQSKYSYS